MPILLADLSLNETVAAGVLTTFCIILLLIGCTCCVACCWLMCYSLWHTAIEPREEKRSVFEMLNTTRCIQEDERNLTANLRRAMSMYTLGTRVAPTADPQNTDEHA